MTPIIPSPRLTLAALWTSMLFIYAYVDLFSLYRADVRAGDPESKQVRRLQLHQPVPEALAELAAGSRIGAPPKLTSK